MREGDSGRVARPWCVGVDNQRQHTTRGLDILDCAPALTERRLERMINEADVLRLYDHLSLSTLLRRYPRRSGSRNLTKALQKRNAGATITSSELEELLIELADELGLPRPETNVILVIDGETFEIDALWRAERVAVELDSREHPSRRSPSSATGAVIAS